MMNTILQKRPSGLLLYRSEANPVSAYWRDDPSYKFVFGLNGTTQYETERGRVVLEPSQFAVLNPHVRYQQVAYEREKFLIELVPEALRQIGAVLHAGYSHDLLFGSHVQKHPQIIQWVHFTKDVVSIQEEESELQLFLDHALAQLSLLLVKYVLNSASRDLATSHLRGVQPLLARAVEMMKERYTEPMTLEEIAAEAGLGKYAFAHLFKETTGVSPYSWLQLYRLVRSQELLRTTNRTVLEIAMACGFSSVRVYNQLFKRTYGRTPVEYRTFAT